MESGKKHERVQILRSGAYIYRDARGTENAVRGDESTSLAAVEREKDGGHGQGRNVPVRDGACGVRGERAGVSAALGEL